MTRRPLSKKTESIEVRVAPEMKQSFTERCERDDRSASEVMRSLMEDYVSSGGPAFGHRGKESGMLVLFSNRIVRLAAVSGGILSLGIMSSPSTAADARLQALFHWFDEDGDSALTGSELFGEEDRAPAPLAGVEVVLTTNDGPMPGETSEDIFDRLDSDGDGGITLLEMVAGARVDSRVEATLLAADQDGSRSVTAAEIAARITEARAAAGASRPAAGAALMAEGLLSAHDADGDGRLMAAELAG